MAITSLPPAPTSSDRDNFETIADTFLSALPTFAEECNTVAEAMNLIALNATSTTSHSAATGSKTFTTQSAKSYVKGMWVVIADSTDPTKQMVAIVTSYSSTTLIVNVQWHSGFGGSLANWVISQCMPWNSNAITDEIYLVGGNGSGSTNTLVRRLTTAVVNSGGSSMTYADSATLGMSITINQTGIYGFNAYNADGATLLLTRNTVTPGMGGADTLSFASVGTGSGANNTGIVIRCAVSDVIRMCVSVTTAGTSGNTYFRAKRIL